MTATQETKTKTKTGGNAMADDTEPEETTEAEPEESPEEEGPEISAMGGDEESGNWLTKTGTFVRNNWGKGLLFLAGAALGKGARSGGSKGGDGGGKGGSK